jgi:hypothetical protein
MSSEEALLQFFFNHGTISCHYRYPKCNTLLDYCSHTGALVFRCQKINKNNRRPCDTRVSILKLTYFDNVHLNLTVIAEIVLLYLTRPPPRCQFIAKETNVFHRILIVGLTTTANKLEGRVKSWKLTRPKLGNLNITRGDI